MWGKEGLLLIFSDSRGKRGRFGRDFDTRLKDMRRYSLKISLWAFHVVALKEYFARNILRWLCDLLKVL